MPNPTNTKMYFHQNWKEAGASQIWQTDEHEAADGTVLPECCSFRAGGDILSTLGGAVQSGSPFRQKRNQSHPLPC